jgi:hypothetical protein
MRGRERAVRFDDLVRGNAGDSFERVDFFRSERSSPSKTISRSKDDDSWRDSAPTVLREYP